MQAPVDYPIDDHARNVQFSVDELTYAARLDRLETLVPEPNPERALSDNPVFSLDDCRPAREPDQSVMRPLTILAQNLLARDNFPGELNPVFTRWSRALR